MLYPNRVPVKDQAATDPRKSRKSALADCHYFASKNQCDGLWKTEEAFKEIFEMVQTAHLRILAALHAVDAERRSSKRQRAA